MPICIRKRGVNAGGLRESDKLKALRIRDNFGNRDGKGERGKATGFIAGARKYDLCA